MKLNNLQNRTVQVSLFLKERLEHDPFVCQKIIKVKGVHRYEKKYYRVVDIEECIMSAESLAELLKDVSDIEVVVEIYLNVNDDDYYQRMQEKTNQVMKSIKSEQLSKKIQSIVSKFI